MALGGKTGLVQLVVYSLDSISYWLLIYYIIIAVVIVVIIIVIIAPSSSRPVHPIASSSECATNYPSRSPATGSNCR
jgi:hypothetical protein